MNRLLSMVVRVSPGRQVEINNHMGRAVQQVVLRQILEPQSPTLSQQQHDPSGIKGYTASTLFVDGTARLIRGRVHPSEFAWFRITGVGDEICTALRSWADARPRLVEIDGYAWHIHDITCISDEHPWASEDTVTGLMQRHHNNGPAYTIAFDFVSPTAFHSESLFVPLPIPILVFRSLMERWNALTNFPLSEHIPFFTQQFVEISKASIETRSVMIRDAVFVGFEGHTKYRINARNEGLERREPEKANAFLRSHSDLSRALGLLADFAFFCGVGVKTGAGLGMTTVID